MRLFNQSEERQIVEAIRQAEVQTTGEICLYLEDFCMLENPLERAYEVFMAYELNKTAYRNAVLIYISQKTRKFAILGDEAIHKVSGGQDFWKKEKNKFLGLLQNGEPCQAVINLIQDIGEVLHQNFPAPEGWDNPNELPDEIIYG